MNRFIEISKCDKCPFYDHKGAFAEISYVPKCTLKNRELPYTVGKSGSMIVARPTFEIPEWCTLPKIGKEQ